jgi:hypothetical protein
LLEVFRVLDPDGDVATQRTFHWVEHPARNRTVHSRRKSKADLFGCYSSFACPDRRNLKKLFAVGLHCFRHSRHYLDRTGLDTGELEVRTLEVAGFEYDGTEVASTFKKELGEAAEIVDRANQEIGEAYKSAKAYASQLRDRYQIGIFASKVAIAVAEIIGPVCPQDYRLTLYLPDFVFSDRLYQFTEYYNKRGEQLPGERAGRTYSVRYGIIGRVWRSGVAEIEGELISTQDRALFLKDQGPIEKFIARRWGLSLEEAIHVKEYNSYGAIRLSIAESKVGLIFFDSKLVNGFGDEAAREKALKAIEAMLVNSPLLPKLLEISHEVAPWSGRIQIFRNS